MKKAIAYIRVSSEDQIKGNGIDRQIETVTSYCKANGLDLTETMIDDGYSASKGYHITDGKLGKFFKNIGSGQYRGYALVVEYLDRLSRLGITETFGLLSTLQKAGVELHEAKNNRVIRSLDDLGTGIMALVDSYQAQEYSKKLGERVGKAWKNKRAVASDGVPMTRNVPSWIDVIGRQYSGAKVTNPGRFVVNLETAQTVREVFRLATLGYGRQQIATQLNGRLQGRSVGWVQTTLNNRAVLGDFTPGGCDTIAGYFPSIVTQSEWEAAQESTSSRRKNGKGKGNRAVNKADNLFSGMLFDVTDGETAALNRTDVPGKNGKKYRYLTTAFSPGKRKNTFKYDDFEPLFLTFLANDLPWKEVAGRNDSEEVKAAAKELDVVLSDLDRINRLIASLNSAMDDPEADFAVLSKKLGQVEVKAADLNAQKGELSVKVASARAKSDTLHNPEALLNLIAQNGPEASEIRLRLKSEIAKRIKRIEFDFNGKSFQTEVNVTFINDVTFRGAMAFGPVQAVA